MKQSIIFIIAFLIGLMGLGFMHEKVHQEIFEHEGIKSKINWFADFPAMTTIAERPCPTESCKLANNINDVVGYHLIIIYSIIGLGFLGLIRILEKILKIQKKEYEN